MTTHSAEQQIAIVREFLLEGWPALSRGDRSVVTLATTDPESSSIAIWGTPLGEFWETMIDLGWAELCPTGPSIPFPENVRLYRFNSLGARMFPEFYDHYELGIMTPFEELSYRRSKIHALVNETLYDMARNGWHALKDKIDEVRLISSTNNDGYYGVNWTARWSDGVGENIDISVSGFLHPSHHKPIVIKSRTLRKRRVFAQLFRAWGSIGS